MITLLLATSAAGGLGSPVEIWGQVLQDFANIARPAQLATFAQVLLIDLVLASDNAIVVGAIAAGLPPAQRRRVILIGIAAALILRIAFALAVSWLMGLVGLVFAGGLLLLWVAWKMGRKLHPAQHAGSPEVQGDEAEPVRPAASFAGAAWAVAVADVSMSLDNVLAIAGAAREHPGILMIGLVLSVALMGLAANLIAKYIERYRWIAYVGLAVIVYVALKMIYEGWVGGEDVVGLSTLL